jgi:putative colanic acid biosynthesis acetyltransferase WcaF
MAAGFRVATGLRRYNLTTSMLQVSAELDIRANRKARKYSRADLASRALWSVGKWLVRLSPRPCFAWRTLVLRLFGATIGPHVRVDPSTRILFPWNLKIGAWSALGQDVRIYNPGLILLGRKVTISHGAHLCSGTHDHSRADLPLLKQPIVVADQVWVCADAFIGPGAQLGAGAVIGARAVVTGRIADWSVVAGNPARVIGIRQLRAASHTDLSS